MKYTENANMNLPENTDTINIDDLNFNFKILDGIIGGALNALIERTITEIHSNVTSIGNYAFYGCTALTTADFPLVTSISNCAFYGCTKLSTLILRKNAVCTLTNINAFTNTPIASSTGYVYVPASLVNTYKTATNWVTYANQIRAIENYPEITGG